MDLSRYPALKESIEREQAAVWANIKDKNKSHVKTSGSFGGRNTYGPLLVMLKADKQAVLVRGATRPGMGVFGRKWDVDVHDLKLSFTPDNLSQTPFLTWRRQ